MDGYIYPYIFGRFDFYSSMANFPIGNSKGVVKFTLASADDIYYLLWPTEDAHPTVQVKGVIYSDNAGQPDALIATTNELVGTIIGWNVLPFVSYVSLTAGDYWLGLIGTANVYSSAIYIANGTLRYNADTYADGPSDPFGTHTLNSDGRVIYASGDRIPMIEISKANYNVVTIPPDISISKMSFSVVTNQRRNKQANMMVIT